jgi:hypothetical protein
VKRRIEGVVIAITRNQEGYRRPTLMDYGSTAHDVGLNLEVEYRIADPTETDSEGEPKRLARKSTIVIPYELRALVTIGDTMVLEFGHTQEWLPAEVEAGSTE